MDLKALRARCEAHLDDLQLPIPFNIHEFARAIGERRGRLILLHPVDSPAGPCGTWLAGPTTDHVFYEHHTSPLHQEHIILHELSHLLCGHRGTSVAEGELQALLLPDLRPEMVEHVLRRRTYCTDDEQEAELLASLILERVARTRSPRAPAPDAATAGLLERLHASLEQPDEIEICPGSC
jgi:hypothetical protein